MVDLARVTVHEMGFASKRSRIAVIFMDRAGSSKTRSGGIFGAPRSDGRRILSKILSH